MQVLKSKIHADVFIGRSTLHKPLSRDYLVLGMSSIDVTDEDAEILLESSRKDIFGEVEVIDEKSALQAKYKQLTGDDAKKTWGVERLTSEVEKAQAAYDQKVAEDLLAQAQELQKPLEDVQVESESQDVEQVE